ncbi:MAG: PHP domain-containing protein [Lachnospiraceae bacterium]
MLANYDCDLHGHTNQSDGNDSPKEFIDHAAERGLKVAAITDHDVRPPGFVYVNGRKKDILSYAQSRQVKLIRGIEISCETLIDDVHLVCFGCRWEDVFFKDLEQFTISSKVKSYKMLIKALQENGIAVTWEEVLGNDGIRVAEEAVQKKMIFELIARKGYADHWKNAKLLVKNSSLFNLKREKPNAVDVIHQIHVQGGIVILAHPFLISDLVLYNGNVRSRKEFIEILIEAGLDGIEACYTYDKTSYDGKMLPNEIELYIRQTYAPRGLIISGGSDYHADGKKGVANPRDIGECGISLKEFEGCPRLMRL